MHYTQLINKSWKRDSAESVEGRRFALRSRARSSPMPSSLGLRQITPGKRIRTIMDVPWFVRKFQLQQDLHFDPEIVYPDLCESSSCNENFNSRRQSGNLHSSARGVWPEPFPTPTSTSCNCLYCSIPRVLPPFYQRERSWKVVVEVTFNFCYLCTVRNNS